MPATARQVATVATAAAAGEQMVPAETAVMPATAETAETAETRNWAAPVLSGKSAAEAVTVESLESPVSVAKRVLVSALPLYLVSLVPKLTEATAATVVLVANQMFQVWPVGTAVPAEMAVQRPLGKQAMAETAAWPESVTPASSVAIMQAPEEVVALVASADLQHRELPATAAWVDLLLVLQVSVAAPWSVGSVGSVALQPQELLVSAALVEWPKQKQTA
jgi:hypothetical protein